MLRGGISYIAKRYSKADKKYTKNYDPKSPPKYISNVDMNNLYGWAMSSSLPYGGFEWLKNVDDFDINLISENSLAGYILYFDLEYPENCFVQ